MEGEEGTARERRRKGEGGKWGKLLPGGERDERP